jgi:hypothetical protein
MGVGASRSICVGMVRFILDENFLLYIINSLNSAILLYKITIGNVVQCRCGLTGDEQVTN